MVTLTVWEVSSGVLAGLEVVWLLAGGGATEEAFDVACPPDGEEETVLLLPCEVVSPDELTSVSSDDTKAVEEAFFEEEGDKEETSFEEEGVSPPQEVSVNTSSPTKTNTAHRV